MSGLNCATRLHDPLAVADVGDPAQNFGRALLRLQCLENGVQRRLGMLDHQQAARAESDDAVADFGADRAAAARHDDGFCAYKILKPPVIDLHAGPQQEVFDGDRRKLDGRPFGIERRKLAHAEAKLAGTDQNRLRPRLRRQRRRRKHKPRHPLAATLQIGDDLLEVLDIAQHAQAADRLAAIRQRRRENADGPDLLDRPTFDAAQQHFGIGGTPENKRRGRIRNLHALQRARIVEVPVGDTQAAQKKHLQKPVQQDGDLAEIECAVHIRRQQDVVEREQRQRQHGRGAE